MRECWPAMEQNAIQWLGAPCCLRGSYAFYKSFGCRDEARQRRGTWRLGEFYFVRCGPQEPVCVAEVTLLWEDQAQHHLLASSRLYFLPEDTPKGRTLEHGEDEVLAVSKKIVIRLEDLVKWTCPEPDSWKRKGQVYGGGNGLHKHQATLLLPGGDSAEQSDQGQAAKYPLSVKVLSYPQYCRFRSLQKRMQDRAQSPSLQDPHLLALGAVQLSTCNTRILYCRDTFNHPTLDSNASIWTELGCSSLSLKGRPRKRKGRDGKGVESRLNSQSEAWIERMKENVMGSVEAQCEGGWLPQPEEQHFLDQLYPFMERRGSPICKVPNLGFKKIDLFLLYSVVKKMGGYETVTAQRLWKQVYNELGGSPGSTSAATCTRRHYEKLILPYDRHLRGVNEEVDPFPKPQPPATANGNKEIPVKRKGPEQPQKDKKAFSVGKQDGRVRWTGAGGQKQARARSRSVSVDRPGGGNRDHSMPKELIPTLPSQQTSPGSALGALPLGLRDGVLPVQELHYNGISGSFQITQGLSPLDLLKSRLGLGSLEESSLSSESRKKLSPLTPSTLVFLQPNAEDGRKLNSRGDGDAYSQPLSPSSPSALQRLHDNGSMGSISLPKGLSALDLLKTRLGLGVTENPDLSAQDSGKNPLSQPSILLSQPKHGSGENKLKPTGDGSNQSSGNGDDNRAQKSILNPPEAPARDTRTRLPMPPLKIIPLDIDCSLQVRQLMRSHLGSSQLNCFTKKLSEVLAQDLSKNYQASSPVPGSQEQTLPLNLSKRSTTKRPADEVEAQGLSPCPSGQDFSKRLKTEWVAADDTIQALKPNSRLTLVPAAQEEAADLSSPKRVRAAQRDGGAQQQENQAKSGLDDTIRAASSDLGGQSTKQGLLTPLPSKGQGDSSAVESKSALCKNGALVTSEVDRHSEHSPPRALVGKSRPERANRRTRITPVKEEQGNPEVRRGSPVAYPLYHFRGRQLQLEDGEAISCVKQADPESFSSEMASLLPPANRGLQSQPSWPLSPHGR
ncbi:uncharacterized protein LOC136762852 [Amia ocellicauda]|uniref:uncharacterized protein LOC136762852 n=1 Tax=Amia ocellicauda TaxID=2972642 RepID=UPI00346487DB|nr:ARI5B protein [Amia calva]